MMDWSERGNIRKRGFCGNPSVRPQLFATYRQTSYGLKKEETLRCPTEAPEETRKSECCPQANAGPGARGAHSGESCTETDVDTGDSSCTKRPLSTGGTHQDAQCQVKRTKQKQTETPYNS